MNEIQKDILPQDPTPTPEDRGGTGRMFTQEEVNKIVSDRLNREREKLQDGGRTDEREQALKAREARLDCREYLSTQGYPAALLDVLDSTDAGKFKAAADKLMKAFPAIAAKPIFEGWKPGESMKRGTEPDRIADAFKPKI